ncbi:ATPase inhibitor subunit zeta [Rhizobium sp. CF122]|uniref:ATPase inhibitor subunit zeta n=1 Tax=Rhizobium sp. CF122 TaxID=1144312 RepID=UPI0002E73AC3|nr:ATPase inhibitor subunit zeta [Rhizobium sp. CF122]
MSALDVQAYVAEIIEVRTTAAGDEGVIAKILADVRAADRVLGEKEFRAHMATLTTNEADAEAPRP